MHKYFSIIVSLVLSAFLLLFVVGCGGGSKKSEQAPAKTVASQEVKKEAPKEEKTGFIVGTDVNAREKASTDSAIVGTFTLGEKVVILADEQEWAKVKRSDGKECYVFKKFLGDQAALDKRQAKYNVKTDVGYPVYLNGDPNYILVDGHMGGAWYIIKNSIQRKQLGQPHIWLISVDVVDVANANQGNTAIGKTTKHEYYFDEKTPQAAISRLHGLRPFNFNGSRAETMVINPTAALSYYIATGKIWQQFGYGKDFYSRADL